MKHHLMFCGLIVTLLLSCSSKNEKIETSITTFLTQGPWTTVLDFEDLNLDGTFIEHGDSCEKDNRWYFNMDGTCKQDNGVILCDPNDDPNEFFSSTWLLQDNDQFLTIQFDFDEVKYYIVSITAQQAVLNVVDPNNPPNQYTQRVVLKR
jgi:hypothetical protein